MKAMSTHTPFPGEYFSNRPPIETGYTVHIGKEGECDMPDTPSAHTPQPACDCYIDDDRLMACPLHAAVPELLEALERAVVEDDYCLGGTCGACYLCVARAAIAKAKGETK